MIVTAPNQKSDHSSRGFVDAVAPLYTKQFKVPVGPPLAKLSVAVIPPRNYGFSASEKWKEDPKQLILKWRIHGSAGGGSEEEAGHDSKSQKAQDLTGGKAWQYIQHMFQEAIPKLPLCRAAGTVVLLPGWGEAKETLLGYALDFANHGYRVVLVDLRGQGQSSGDYVTYGLIEHRDISQVITALYQRGVVVGKLALVGVSEGATIALDAAAADDRIDAVVAIAPFVKLKTAIRATANQFMPHISKAVSEEELSHAVVIAGHRVGMNLADANPITRVSRIQAPVLYIAGGKDEIAPADDVKRLASKTPNARFVKIPRYPHIGLYFGVAKVAPPALEALAKTMGLSPDSTCLAAPPPKDANYALPFTVTLTDSD